MPNLHPMHYKLTRLLLLPTANKPTTTAEAFIANPPIDQESLLGKLFFVAEIENNRPSARKVLDFLAESLSAHYYQAEKISMREKMGTVHVAEIFEAAIARTNADFELFIKRERIKIAPKSYAITAGVIHNATLVFSTAGSIQATLLYPDPAASEEQKKRYKITTISDTDPQEKKVRLEKLFSNVTEGKVPAEGYVVLSNEILPEYITNKHLSKIITTLPPQSAVEQIKNQLHKINNHVTFVALIIKNSKTPHVKRAIPELNVNVTAHHSLERMQDTEHTTERYLSPAGAGIGSGLQRLGRRAKGIFARTPKVTAPLRDKLFFAKKSRLKITGTIGKGVAIFGATVGAGATRIGRAARNPQAIWKKTQQTAQSIVGFVAGTIRWVMRLPRLHQALLAIFVVAITLFVFNIYRQNQDEQLVVNQAEYQAALQELQQQHNQIRASLLYRNEEGARELLGEAQESLNAFIAMAGQDAPIVATLRQEQQDYLDSLSNVTVVSDPETVATLAHGANHLLGFTDTIIAFAANETTLTSVAVATGETTQLTAPEPIVHGTVLNEDEAVVFGKTEGLLIASDATTEAIDGVFERADERVTAVGSYNNRLYAIDTDQNQLWRYAINFNSKQGWLKEAVALANVTDMAIDGYIYLGFTNGTVQRYLSGYQNEFELADVTPPLAQTNSIALTGDSDDGLVYVLETQGKRIVVFDKTGSFIAQYRFENLATVNDFAIAPDNSRGWVLGEQTIYTFPLNDPSEDTAP